VAIGSAYLKDAQIVVIGAGAVGSVIAYRLAQAGAKVSIVERRYPGSGTTGSSFAWMNSFGKPPRDYHRFNARSMREHLDLARELDGDWVHPDGGLWWEHASDHTRSNLAKERVRQIHQWGYRIETVSPEQVMSELEPDLFIDPDLVEEVYYAPNEGWINGVGLCHGVTSAARLRYGANFVNDEVAGFSQSLGAVDGVQLAGGDTLPADAVINAAGPDAARVAALAGIDLPVARQPGVLVVTEPAPVNLKAVVHCPETFVHADGGWRLLLHRDDYDQLVESEQPLERDHPHGPRAIENATAVVPNLKGIEPEGIRMGIRAMPKDGHPIIGFDPAVSGLYHSVMHSGVTLSASVGILVSEDLMGQEPPELAPYRPERFVDQAKLAVD
jgi:glycine/D-amino acid oxidase-like deaminating enzyme